MIKPAYSFSFLLSINIFVWQNVLYFLDAPRKLLYGYKLYTCRMRILCSLRLVFTAAADARHEIRLFYRRGRLAVKAASVLSVVVEEHRISRNSFFLY